MNNRYQLLEYRLRDVLELKFTSRPKIIRAVIQKLLRRRIRDSNLYCPPTFVLEDALVVIQDGARNRIRQLYLLNAEDQSVQVFHVTSAGRMDTDGRSCDHMRGGI